jgi:hypothetical protein
MSLTADFRGETVTAATGGAETARSGIPNA